MAALVVTYKKIMDENGLDVLSAECWTATPQLFDGLAPCAVYGILNDMGYLVSCESDIHCAITMVVLKAATLGEGKPLFGEFTYIHHFVEMAGDYTGELREFCKYIPNLRIDRALDR